ncbi:MAG: L-threonylcarbamoyladenylate synthase [bacterium]|nr:L-threonylcarbamoyladenylate synthase [bacterium]
MTSKEVIKIIKDGGVGVLPTDTLYGLVASVFSKKGVKRVYQIKKRNSKKPCIILIHSLDDLDIFGVKLTKNQETFLKTIWPDKVSVILEVGQGRTEIGHRIGQEKGGRTLDRTFKMSYLKPLNKTLAFRMPKSVWLKNLLKSTGPLIAPSCNKEGKEPAQTIKQAKDYFASQVDFYFDKGKLKGEASTLIALKGERVVVLRQGTTKIQMITTIRTTKNQPILKEQFLVSITTTKGADWEARIKEIDKLKIKKLALFVTCVNEKERKKLYQALEKTSLKEIPFCHIRSDMPFQELDYLTKRWQTKVFNLHTSREFPIKIDYKGLKKKIFIENVFMGFDEQELKIFGGVCLDFAHLENDRLNKHRRYQETIKALATYSLGCNHISAICKEPFRFLEETKYGLRDENRFDRHSFTSFKDFAYLKRYPLKYFSKYCALEVENPLKEQLQAIDYIVKQIKNQKSKTKD